MSRKYAAVLAVILLAGLSGCATVSVTAEVDSASTIESYDMNISTSTTGTGSSSGRQNKMGTTVLRTR